MTSLLLQLLKVTVYAPYSMFCETIRADILRVALYASNKYFLCHQASIFFSQSTESGNFLILHTASVSSPSTRQNKKPIKFLLFYLIGSRLLCNTVVQKVKFKSCKQIEIWFVQFGHFSFSSFSRNSVIRLLHWHILRVILTL